MSHIVESCPLTKLNGGLSRLHSADEDAVSWMTMMVHDTHTLKLNAFIYMLSIGNVTLTTPTQGAVHILFTITCHDPPTHQTISVYIFTRSIDRSKSQI